MLEQCKEIVHKFNSVYGETLVDPDIMLPQNNACLRLPGIDGKAKMSKSLGNCIYLSDEPEDIKKKVMSMYTERIPVRLKATLFSPIWMLSAPKSTLPNSCRTTLTWTS